jgi:hypothetical protein
MPKALPVKTQCGSGKSPKKTFTRQELASLPAICTIYGVAKHLGIKRWTVQRWRDRWDIYNTLVDPKGKRPRREFLRSDLIRWLAKTSRIS